MTSFSTQTSVHILHIAIKNSTLNIASLAISDITDVFVISTISSSLPRRLGVYKRQSDPDCLFWFTFLSVFIGNVRDL